MRESQWAQNCPDCQNERLVSYSQARNIRTNKSTRLCRPCAILSGVIKINKEGLKKGRKYNKRPTRSFKNKTTQYVNLFNNPAKYSQKSMRDAKLGKRKEETNNWQGGKAQERQMLMSQDDYKNWRLSVFTRDSYTCQRCMVVGSTLHAHHIKMWSKYPEYRYEVSNGLTLCKSCHINEHKGRNCES